VCSLDIGLSNEMVSKNLGLIFALIGGIIGSLIGGIAENVLWTAGDLSIEIISDCDNLKNDWADICEQNKFYYYFGKSLFYIVGFMIPFILLLKLILRNFSK